MKRIIPFAAGLLLLCSFKTPETSSLFEKWTEPESGVQMYVLKQGLADYNQQGFYFTSKSMTNDGRFLVFFSCPDEMVPEGKKVKDYWVIDFKTDKLIKLDLKKVYGQAWLDVDNNILYGHDYKRKVIYCRRLNEDPTKEVILCSIPKELQDMGEMKSPCLHSSVTRDGKYMFFDCRVEDRFVQGLVEFSTGKFIKWYESDHIINHGNIHPYRNDIALAAYETKWTDKNGVNHSIKDVPGPYPRLQLLQPGKKEMVPSMTNYATHECWTTDGKGFYWCGGGVVMCDLETREQQIICPYGAHASLSENNRYVVSDIRIGRMYRGEPWRLFFYDRETQRGKFICQILPPATPYMQPSKYHPDPHPCFVCHDKYIVFTKNEWTHRFNLAVIPVEALSKRLNTEWLGELPEQSKPLNVYRRIARQLISTEPEAYAPKGYDGKRPVGNGKCIAYSVTSAYVNALQIADNVADKALRDSIGMKFKPFQNGSKKHLQSLDYHVDHSIFGSLALEYFRVLGNNDMKELGLRYADHQWAEPSKEQPYPGYIAPYEKQLEYLRQGYSPQTRLWIDDMYMINLLQTQAYRATGDPKYIERAAKEMVLYLKELQQPDGLFHHAAEVPFVWGRGDGWMAAGMPMILQYLTPESEYYAPIREGYLKMMKSLLKWQRKNGLWGQLITDKESWDETSCSAMFTYAFIQGVKHGWLDAKTYGAAARKAWLTLTGMLDECGNLSGICVGTGARNDRQWYMDRPRVNGDPHGQAPMLWICNALL